jgi:hypothetical protein
VCASSTACHHGWESPHAREHHGTPAEQQQQQQQQGVSTSSRCTCSSTQQ